MEEDGSGEGEEGEGLCAQLPVSEDQVPAVGQQTEIGEDTGEEDDDVVSSLSLCERESGGTSEYQQETEGESVNPSGRWYAHGTAHAQTHMDQEVANSVQPDSVQQEETVTTSSELVAVTLPHGHADSSVVINDSAGVAREDDENVSGSAKAGSGIEVLRRGAGLSLVNYDSSDSENSGVETPKLSLYREENHQYQYADSNSQPQETANQNLNQDGSGGGQVEQGGAGEQGGEAGESSGYWNSEGCWVDSKGQVWQPQGQDGYWQGQQWSQQTDAQAGSWQGYDSGQGESVPGCDSQGKQKQGQEGGEQVVERQSEEQQWQVEAGKEADQQTVVQGSEGQQQWSGNNSSSTSNQQDQSQHYSSEYYQQQYAGQQYDSSAATDSTQQQYYDQSAYYSQEGYTSDGSQQQVVQSEAEYSQDSVETSQTSSETPLLQETVQQDSMETSQTELSQESVQQSSGYSDSSQQAPLSESGQQDSSSQPVEPVDYSQHQGSEAPGYSEHPQTTSDQWSNAYQDQSHTCRPQDQEHYSQGKETQYSYQQTQSHSQPDQPQYTQEDAAQYSHQDQVQAYNQQPAEFSDRQVQSRDQSEQAKYSQQDQEQGYGQQDQYNTEAHSYEHQAQYSQPAHLYAQSDETQSYSQQYQYNQQQVQSYDSQNQAQHTPQHAHSSYSHQEQQYYGQTGWNEQQQSGSYSRQGYDSQTQSHQHPHHRSEGAQGQSSWNYSDQRDGGSYYQYAERAAQPGTEAYNQDRGYQTWQQPAQQQEQQYYGQHYGSQQSYGAQQPGYSQASAYPAVPPNVPPPFPPPPAPPSLPPPPPPNHPPPLPPHPPPFIPPPPPSHSHIPPPPPPSHPPPSLLPQPPPPSHYHHDGNYSHSPSPQPPWQSRDSQHSDSHWQRRKFRQTSPQSRGSHSGSSVVPSSPVNSVSSDVSSTSRDSPTPTAAAVHRSPPVQRTRSPAPGSTEHGTQKSSSGPKSVFSQQLCDPRQPSSPSGTAAKKSYLTSSKYTNAASSLVHKRSAMLKQQSGIASKTSAVSAGPPVVEPHHAKTEKEGKSKGQGGEPASFPKGSLSGFRIPKHNKSSEQSKSYSVVSNQSSSPLSTTVKPTSVQEQEEVQSATLSKTEMNETVVKDSVDTVKKEREISTQTEVRKKTDTAVSAVEKAKDSTCAGLQISSPPAMELDVASAQPAAVEEGKALPPESKASSSTEPSGGGSRQDIVSLFKSIDSNTLYALASTIQLALSSSSTQLTTSTLESKILSTSASTTAQETTEDVLRETKSTGTSSPDAAPDATPDATPDAAPDATPDATPDAAPDVTPDAAPDAAPVEKKTTEEHVFQQTTPTDASPTNVEKETTEDVAQQTTPPVTLPAAAAAQVNKAVDTELRFLLSTKSELTQIKSNAKPVGRGTPRTVIATVLSSNTGARPKPNVAETSSVRKNDALTVCIPIKKETKIQVQTEKETKSDSSPNQLMHDKSVGTDGHKGAQIRTGLDQNDDTSQYCKAASDEPETTSDKAPALKSPTMSLLTAQELMFDPKYMYKEYNLRIRKQETPDPASPQKKQKVDKSPEKVPATSEEEMEESTEEMVSAQQTGKRKRGRPRLQSKGSSEEPPEAKKQKEEVKSTIVTASRSSEDNRVEHAISKSMTGGHHTAKLGLKLSIHRTKRPSSSTPPPPTTPAHPPPVASAADVSPSPKKPKEQDVCIAEKKSPDKTQETTVKSPKKPLPSVIGVHQTRISKSQSRSKLLCTLCGEKGGMSSLGFLFGPYFYQHDSESSDGVSSSGGSSSVEVWVHEDCCVWAPGVCLVGRELQGLREALIDANKMVCTVCKRLGATLCCATRGCKSVYHFPCAVEKGCVLNEEQFQMQCSKHKENVQIQAD